MQVKRRKLAGGHWLGHEDFDTPNDLLQKHVLLTPNAPSDTMLWGLNMSTKPIRIHREVSIPIDVDLNSSFCVSGRTPFQDVDPNSSLLVSSGDCIQMDIDSSHLTVKLDNFCTTRETTMVKYHPLSVAGLTLLCIRLVPKCSFMGCRMQHI